MSVSDQWTLQTMQRVESLLFSHAKQLPKISQPMFLNLLKQYEADPKDELHDSLSKFMLMVSMWGLVRMHNTTDLESRRQYGLFINHLQDAENALLKSIQLSQKTPATSTPSTTIITQPVPASRVVQTSLPISTTTQL
jgi:hypothetical protein